MIQHPAFVIEPWSLTETELHFNTLEQTESLFALSNGHVGVRGNLDEGEPHGLPGTYLNGFYERYPLPYAEAGYGFPADGQTVINVTSGKLFRLLVDDEPFDVHYGTLHTHKRVLDFRTGTLTRYVEWTSPAGSKLRLTSVRLVSFTHRAILAISYQIEPVDTALRVLVQSELIANEQLPTRKGDPRAATLLDAPLVPESSAGSGTRGVLVHHTRHSHLRVAAAMQHLVAGSPEVTWSCVTQPDLVRTSIADTIAPGKPLVVTKFVAYGWTHEQRSITALRDQVEAALEAARLTGWDNLQREQRQYLDDYWERADVELDGDLELQQALRFSLFHVLQAAARAERRAIPAKGLTGTGYDGHSFWDTETFVLPMLIHTLPDAAADALRWRHSTLKLAQQRAQELGLAGAAFPWRTIHGEECSGYWPAGTAAFHVNADIADAVLRYLDATDDRAFEREVGLTILVETARLFRSLGHFEADGAFCIDGVTGPDEYSAIADNNIYTNLMAQRNLRAAVRACQRLPDDARDHGVSLDEMAGWTAAADRMYLPFNAKLEVHEQAEGFTKHAVWDFARMRPSDYPLMLHYPYFDLYRKQVVKQPDLVLAMQLCSTAFSPEQKARNFAYYERITVRDSSLSACTQAVLAAEVGQLRLALDYAAEAALIDLSNFQHNARDGLHLASLAGTWTSIVIGFGGMRDECGTLSFTPRLPDGIVRLAFRMVHRGVLLQVEVTATRATYRLLRRLDGAETPRELELLHYGELVRLSAKAPAVRPLPAPIVCEPVEQPPGRAPAPRVQSAIGRRATPPEARRA